tara:strand:- start:5249 stop:7762 length:2514 start_codon:yes stop_codon:yes gene_type:complete
MTFRAINRDSIKIATALVASAVLSGCLSEEIPTAEVADGRELSMSGSVGDGPIVNASMAVLATTGETIAEFESDSSAAYDVTVVATDQQYPLTVEAFGGTDLVTNAAPDFMMLSAVVNQSDSTVANVNPFSTFTVELAQQMNGGLNSSNLQAAQQIVVDALNSGLSGMRNSSPISTPIDETNIAEIVKASETLAETIRRVRDLMNGAGFSIDAGAVVSRLASDLTDSIVDGQGGSATDRRTAAVSTIVSAQVLLESMSNQLRVNGIDATSAMDSAIGQVSPATPTISLEQLPLTDEVIRKARVALAAAYSIDESASIGQLHTTVSGLQEGQTAATVRVVLPSNYRTVLQTAVQSIAGADIATIDRVNAIARTNGDLDLPNLAPVISGTPPTSATVANAYSFTPTASDSDGDTLVFSATNTPSWATFDTATGQLSGTPESGDIGTHSGIVISVSDGEFSDSLPAFSITVGAQNSAPQISGSPGTSVNEGQNYSFTPTASDADGDTLAFSIVNRPAWASFDSATGELSGVPPQGAAGSYSGIVITVSDGTDSASLSAFTLTVMAVVSNSPPQISGTPSSSVTENEFYSFTPSASDADGDTLTFSISGRPGWATFNSSSGRLSGTPGTGDAGTYSGILISVSDGSASASLPAFSIVVNEEANAAPQISGTPSSSVNENESYSFTPTASDSDGDTLTFSVSGLPGWASFNSSTGQISGTPSSADVGTYSGISISVSDGTLSDSLGPFTITVQASSLGSVTLNWTAPTENDDGSALTDLAGYKLYWGTVSGNYPNSITINNPSVTTYIVDNLSPGTYEFVATSFNSSGVESIYSGTATKTVP